MPERPKLPGHSLRLESHCYRRGDHNSEKTNLMNASERLVLMVAH